MRGAEERGQYPIQDGQLVAPAAEMRVDRRPQVVRTSQVDHGQGRQEGQHADRAGIETKTAKDPSEVQPVSGQDGAGVRH